MTDPTPLTAMFDDLIRHYEQLISYDSTSEFLQFVISQEENLRKWSAAEEKCKRLQGELENAQTQNASQERKIIEVRKHLEGKMELINKVELEKDRISMKNLSAKELIQAYLKDGKMSLEFKERLNSILKMLETGDRSILSSRAGQRLDTISEAESTDLSMTESEDDFDVFLSRNRRLRSSKQASLTQQEVPTKRTRQSNSNHPHEHLVTKTVISFPKNGSVQASVETYSSNNNGRRYPTQSTPVARPVASDSESETGGWRVTPSPRLGQTLSSGGAMALRPHEFCNKTVIKPETCEPCGRKIKFSKMALKCRDCKATCHPDCKDNVPIPCVPTGTPINRRQMGTIADYVPSQRPMVPALVQHCVNEIEIRGLDTVGLYRVPGPEKEVKDLKEKFLKGKGVPNLARYDIHAICGCIKDFLRSLQEPIVGRWFCFDFANATTTDLEDSLYRQDEIERLVQDLPPPNQDTLAFLILHLQRIAETPEVKMPVGNLAKVFGPTIVGHWNKDLNATTLLKETKKQQRILDTLLNISSGYWKKFIDGKAFPSGGTYTGAKGRRKQSPQPTTSSSMLPTASATASTISVSSGDQIRDTKKIYFSDDSPKEQMKTRGTKQKRRFFD